MITIIDALLTEEVDPFQLQLHKGNANMEEFYKNCIPKSNLPSDYGGECPSIEELNDTFHKDLLSMRDYFIWEEGQRKKDLNDNSIITTSKAMKQLEID